MSLPRELSLRATREGLRLVQQPAREFQRLRGRHHRLDNTSAAEANAWLGHRAITNELLEIAVEFEPAGSAGIFGLKLRTGADEVVTVGCDLSQNRSYLDRTRSGRTDFYSKFTGTHEGPLRLHHGRVQLRAIVDRSSVEVFLNGGETVISDVFFPSAEERHVELFSRSNLPQPKVRSLDVWELKSVWR